MKCRHCGAQNSEFDYNCTKCGKELATSRKVYKHYKPIEPSHHDGADTEQFHESNNISNSEFPHVTENINIQSINPTITTNSSLYSSVVKFFIAHVFLLTIGSFISLAGIIVSIIAYNSIKSNDISKAERLSKINKRLLFISVFLQ